MYLEISAPQSGKTHRLLQNVYFHLHKNKGQVCIYSPLKISDLLGIYTPLIKYSERITCRQVIPSPQEHSFIFDRTYYDEFDQLPNVPLTNAYYVTSPSFPRTKDIIVTWEKGKSSDVLLSVIAFASLRLKHVVNFDSDMRRQEFPFFKERNREKDSAEKFIRQYRTNDSDEISPAPVPENLYSLFDE